MTPPDAAAAKPQSPDWRIRLIETFAPFMRRQGPVWISSLILLGGGGYMAFRAFDLWRETTSEFRSEVRTCHAEQCGKLDKIADELKSSNSFLRRLLIKRGDDPDDGVIGTAGPQ